MKKYVSWRQVCTSPHPRFCCILFRLVCSNSGRQLLHLFPANRIRGRFERALALKIDRDISCGYPAGRVTSGRVSSIYTMSLGKETDFSIFSCRVADFISAQASASISDKRIPSTAFVTINPRQVVRREREGRNQAWFAARFLRKPVDCSRAKSRVETILM